jgi:hypothetical protein
MLKRLDWVIGLGIVGLVLSAIASVLNAVLKGGSQWTAGVIAAALLSMALALIPFLKSTQQFHARVEALIAAIGPDHDTLAQLRQLLRSVIFRDEYGFDPVFWTAYGQSVLSQNERDQYQRMKSVAEAAVAKRVIVGRDDAYAMMGLLFHRIQSQHMKYLATATEEETKDAHAQFLLFEFPKQRPDCVQRIFIVDDRKAFISGLSDSQREDLIAQLENHTQLSVLVRTSPTEDVPNFGIYGNIAVGRLLPNGANEFDFNQPRVVSETGRYDGYWQRARPLSIYSDRQSGGRTLV